jgi:hypothetical protein
VIGERRRLMSQANKAIEGRFIEEVLNNKNLAAADELVAEVFVELDPFPGQEQGREGLKQVLRMRGTHRGEFLGLPPTGRQVKVKGVVIDRIVEGRIVESRILMDNFGLMQQLGVIPTPPQQAEAS